jgi:hypothetical protein
MHPYVGGVAYYPKDSDHNTAEYRLSININGAKRHAYNDMTKKEIYISIKRKDDTVLLERQYTLQAAGLHWDVSWAHLNDLNIVFYDEQGLIKLTDRNELSHIPRRIFTLYFTFHPDSGKFIESYVPDYVTSKIRNRLERAKKTHVVSLYLRIDNNNTQTILDSLQKIAKDFNLSENKVPNCMNCFAYFMGDDIEMNSIHFKESEKGNLVIEVVDWGRKELSRDIVASLKQSLDITRAEER